MNIFVLQKLREASKAPKHSFSKEKGLFTQIANSEILFHNIEWQIMLY